MANRQIYYKTDKAKKDIPGKAKNKDKEKK